MIERVAEVIGVVGIFGTANYSWECEEVSMISRIRSINDGIRKFCFDVIIRCVLVRRDGAGMFR